MSKFKVGDRVKCIDAEETWNFLQVNMIYIVKETSKDMYNDYVYLEEITNCSWYANRFKLYNPCEDILQDIIYNA